VLPPDSSFVSRQLLIDVAAAATPTIIAAPEMISRTVGSLALPIMGSDSGTICGKQDCAAIA
jgi:hypothetical protein